MKLITWNCRVGGFRRKAPYVAAERPDILAVQEVEPLNAASTLAGDSQPTFRDRSAEPAFPSRGIGVFSYTGLDLRVVDEVDRMYSFRRYEAHRKGATFNVVAVWPWQTRTARTSYRQAHDGLLRHSDWIRERPTVILGDFNSNASFKGRNWSDLMDLLMPLGLVSAYHTFYDIEPGSEIHPTHFHGGCQDRPFHLDYCFVPIGWVPALRSVEVGTYGDWHSISDHTPVIVSLDL